MTAFARADGRTRAGNIPLAEALPQLKIGMQRRLAEHLATREGFSTTDRLISELAGQYPANTFDREIWRARYSAAQSQIHGALRRLQNIGYVRYDSEHGGWWR